MRKENSWLGVLNVKILEHEIRGIFWKSVIQACKFPETEHREASLSGTLSETPNVWFGEHQAFSGDRKGHLKKFLLMLVIKFINSLKVHLKMKFQSAASFSITCADRPIFDVSFLMD